MRKQLLIILATQDFQYANHRGLWIELSKKVDVLVANIPADYLTSTITKKAYRIRDARSGGIDVSGHLKVFRPLLMLRPEVAPDMMYPRLAKEFWKQVEEMYFDLTSYEIDIIAYDGRWIKILKNTRDNLRFAYYLFDEVRNNGRDGSSDRTRTKYDDYACRNADFMLAMTEVLANHRSEYNIKKIVIGNGAELPQKAKDSDLKVSNSVAFIGNFRDWIDQDLLLELIQMNRNLLFCFVGPIEKNMKNFMDNLLNTHMNTAYFGQVAKDKIACIYRMFDVVIIPYRQNDFIRATRPIKIVESVLAGTPVVTIPVNGYTETAFIRFAEDAITFSREIEYVLQHNTIRENYSEYQRFVEENMWTKKADIILREFKESRSGI